MTFILFIHPLQRTHYRHCQIIAKLAFNFWNCGPSQNA